MDIKDIRNFRDFHEKAIGKFYEKNGYLKDEKIVVEEIEKYVTVEHHYGESFRGYIEFCDEQELRNNEFFKKFYNEYSEKYKKIMDARIKFFEVNTSNLNRGYRSKNKRLSVDTIEMLYSYDNFGFDAIDFLNGKVYFEFFNDYFLFNIFAAEFVINSDFVEYFKKMVYDNENLKSLSDQLIKGAIVSNNEEVVNAVFDLLKAAKLSEGLRSTIVNFIDYGSLDNYKKFLKYIREENLLRFSSVKNAFMLYTGKYADGHDYTHRANYVMDCLLDNKTEEYLKDENPLKVYVALYALACEDVQKAFTYIYDNYKEAKDYRRVTFIDFLKESNEIVNSKVITYCLKNEEQDNIKAMIIAKMPSFTFENDEDKKEYLFAFFDTIKNLKLTAQYSLYEDAGNISLSINYLYNDALQYVKELNDSNLYEVAYESFGKYGDVHGWSRQGKCDYLDKIYHDAQRRALINGISLNYSCLHYIKKLNLDFSDDEYIEIAKHFKTKRGDLRGELCGLFKKAEPNIIFKCSKYLISQKKDELKSGGLSILVDNLDRVQDESEFLEIKEIVGQTEFAHEVETLKETILGEKVVFEEKVVETQIFDVPTLTWDEEIVKKFTEYDFTKFTNLVTKWWDMFMAHNGEEVEATYYDGGKITQIIGTDIRCVRQDRWCDDENKKEFEKYFLYKEFLHELDGFSDEELELIHFLRTEAYIYCGYVRNGMATYSRDRRVNYQRYDYYIENKVFPNYKVVTDFLKDDELGEYKIANFNNIISMIFDYLNKDFDKSENFNKMMINYLAFQVEYFKNNVDSLPEYFDYSKDEALKVPFTRSLNILENLIYFDDNYVFDILKNMFSFFDKKYSPTASVVYFYFLEKGFLNKEFLINRLLTPEFKCIERQRARLEIIAISNEIGGSGSVKECAVFKPYIPLAREVYNEVVNIMLETELKRTDSNTKYTAVLACLSRFYGVETFAKALDKMKKIEFVRAYSYSNNLGIKDIFSQILSDTVPEEDLTDEKFAEVIKKYKIADQKLLEACLYNRYFTKFGAKYLNINGLEKVMYYFKAHSLDDANSLLDEEKVMINRYSDFELEDFVDGKMDIKWFKEIPEEMSVEDYEKVYDASKYIMGTAKRKRGQYFADAITGRLDIKEVEEKINDKRNQDMLICFGLIPLGEGDEKEKETLRRYKRIQLFFKESKQFGAQRRATETRRGNIALSNLATNYGLDINRFTWVMEAMLIDDVKAVFEPTEIDEIIVYLSLKDVRNPKVIVTKGGKELKAVPPKYKKDEHILKINEVKNDIKNQYARARITLENSMCNSDLFTLEEIGLINTHPIVKEIVKDILFVSGDFVGFLRDEMLVDFEGNTKELKADAKVRIAHCVDLYEHNWDKWQKYMMENQIVQPFKQVFRELYTLTDEEKVNDGYTNRFAGYQIELKKARGVLSSRNWISSYYSGFEKVNHAHNLRVDLYCYNNINNANNFEEETLEKVTFIDNKTNKTKDMKELDKVMFSETMRDLDLVVSVAYVGGVDPLLNHTTLEMRKRILEHNLGLFKISNFEFKDKFIVISGTLGKYSIHLGSGVVAVEGKGMLPMTPVHSQNRGHIFLPFVDEDPKTSEIVTKVLMLAEDDKLKDPTILQYLR